jgi:hypothetical protein
MAAGRLAEYDSRQAINRLKITEAHWRWAQHRQLIPAPDATEGRWLRATVEAIDVTRIRRELPDGPIGNHEAANRIAIALGTPNPPGGPDHVKAFTVRRFIARGLLVALSWDGTCVHPAQVARLCRRATLRRLVDEETPLGPDQSAARLGIRRSDWDHVVRLGWIKPTEWRKVEFGTSKAGAVDVPIYRSGDVDKIPGQHRRVDWERVQSLGKGQRSPLAKL